MKYLDIRRARKLAGKSQDEVAKALDVNRATISKYETGAIEPTISQLMKIADFLQVDLEDLFDKEKKFFEEGYRLGFESGIEANSKSTTIEALAIKAVWGEEGYAFSEKEMELVKAFSQLNPDGQNKAVERVEELAEIPKYQKEKPPQD